MSSLNVSLTLNDRLAQASKKFTKACEQIKLIKQQISEYIGMFAYSDGSQFAAASDLSVEQQLLYNNGHLFVSCCKCCNVNCNEGCKIGCSKGGNKKFHLKDCHGCCYRGGSGSNSNSYCSGSVRSSSS